MNHLGLGGGKIQYLSGVSSLINVTFGFDFLLCSKVFNLVQNLAKEIDSPGNS